MENLSKLLERFSKILNRDASTKEAIASVIAERTKVSLKPEDFTLKDGVLEVNASAVAKNEIRLKEEMIKDELKNIHRLSISKIFYK
ncbi:MAG: hypothetical protein Q7R67_02865 [bacterium]|nr:hypothetical protein [bacterium]